MTGPSEADVVWDAMAAPRDLKVNVVSYDRDLAVFRIAIDIALDRKTFSRRRRTIGRYAKAGLKLFFVDE